MWLGLSIVSRFPGFLDRKRSTFTVLVALERMEFALALGREAHEERLRGKI